MMTDPLGDMITRVRNAQKALHDFVKVPFSKLRWSAAQAMLRAGVVRSCDVLEEDSAAKKSIQINLRYYRGQGAACGLKRISKPGRRVYCTYRMLKNSRDARGGFATILRIISTSKGVLLDQEAVKQGVGGECLFEVA